jgi:pimeloyl-ACP methyl ester carboxylesterase
MRRHHCAPALLTLLFSFGSLAARPKTTACKVPGLNESARCGSLRVWENRETRKGRRIDIHFIVVPAPGSGGAKEALIFFSGGPGQAATDSAGPITLQLPNAREGRDLLFVDVRGTGRSNPLPCASAKPTELQSYLTGFYTPADVARCAKELRPRADVLQYHSAPAMDDVEDVRAALGYDRVVLFGISYGTRAALVFLRRHPAHVRAVLLHGVAPTDTRYPLTVPKDAQIAIDGVFTDCARDPGCHTAFPDPAADLTQSLERFAQGPVQAKVLDARTSRMTTVSLSRDRYTEALRALLYDAGSSSLVPSVVHRAAQGDFGPAAEEELAWRMALEGHSRGVHLAVTCPEDVDFIDLTEAGQVAQGSFMSAWRAADQKAACAVWPHHKLDRSVLEPVRSNVPLLIMNGAYDPATALYHAERLVRGFPNGRVIAIPSGGHSTNGLEGIEPCYDQIVQQFIRTADARNLDAECMGRVHRGPFPTEFPGGEPVEMNADQLARFGGKYSGPYPLEIRVQEGKLHALFAGEDDVLLPIGPTRFRFVSPPHAALVFQEKAGSVVAVDLLNGGAPVETYTRN